MTQKLMLSNTNKVIGGVCGGLGEYFDVDPVFVRIVAVILGLAHGFGILAYLIAWIIMPKKPVVLDDNQNEVTVEHVNAVKPIHASWRRYWPGMILVGLGVIMLVREYGYWFDWSEFWPVLLILMGLILIFRRTNRSKNEEESTDPGYNRNGYDEGGSTR